jgi:hypothetical protein
MGSTKLPRCLMDSLFTGEVTGSRKRTTTPSKVSVGRIERAQALWNVWRLIHGLNITVTSSIMIPKRQA